MWLATFWLTTWECFFFFLSTIELHFQTAAHRPEEVTHQDLVLSSGFVYSGQPEKWRKRPYLYPLLVFILLRCCFCMVSSLVPFPSTPISSSQPVPTVPSLKKVLYWYSPPHPNTLHPPFSVSPSSLSGVLSQFNLILWGIGPSVVNPSSSDFPRPSNNSCKTFDAQQICIGELIPPTHKLWTGAT